MTWFNVSYLRKKQITIDHTKVSGGSDLASFPVLISRTDTDLKTVGNGGLVQNSSGFDIIFTDSTEATKLDHEIENYVASTGEIEMWVRIPTLSASVDTVTYMYYDNSGISTSQENKTGVWDSNYKLVQHLGNGTTLSVSDSTSNANNGTNSGATVSSSGKIDGGASFNGSSAYIGQPNILASNAGTITLSCWFNTSTANGVFLDYSGNDPSAAPSNWSPILLVDTNGKLRGELNQGSIAQIVSTASVNNGAWHHVALTNAASTQTLYLDGASIGTLSGTANTAITPNVHLGAGYSSSAWGSSVTGWSYFNGTLDEFRLSNVARSSGWITTEYNSQNSPATFYSVGSAQSQSPGVHFRIFNGYGGVFS